MVLNFEAASDSGMKRNLNEDSFIADPESGFFAVADGMGGHTAGEVASRMAVEAVHQLIRSIAPSDVEADPLYDPSVSHDANLLRMAILEGNRRILSSSMKNGELRGMGTTIVAVKIREDSLAVGFVGDSRAYLIRDGKIRQITMDHSWINEQINIGLMNKSEAEGHPLRNVITRALGINEEVKVDVADQSLLPNDMLLLCSDGLNTSLSDNEILESILSHRNDIRNACRALIEKANTNGGEDNVTVILIKAAA